MIKYRYLLFISLISVTNFLSSKDVTFTSLGITEGLSQLTVHSIYQDENGAMWFGTRRGLNRYDGNQIEKIPIYPIPRGMTQEHIWNIVGDHHGHLFIRASNNLLRYDLYKQKFEILLEGNVNYTQYHNGEIYISNYVEINIYNPEIKELRPFVKLENKHFPIKQILISRLGTIWIATNAGLMKVTKEGQNEKTFFEGKLITAIKEDSNLMLWIGTYDDGLFRLNPHNETYSLYGDKFIHNDIRCIEEDNNGELWIGTFYGLFRLNPITGEKQQYLPVEKMPHTLSHSSIYSLYKDKQGTIWAGTYFGGVNYFSPANNIFRIYSSSSFYPNHISFPIVGNITEDSEGNIWICTEGGGLNKLNPKTGNLKIFKHSHSKNSISHNNLKSILYNSELNQLFIGTHTGGLTVLKLPEEKFKVYLNKPDDPESLPSNVVNRITGYKDLIFLHTQSGFYRFDPNAENFSPLFFFEGGETQQLFPSITYFDSKGRLWSTFYSNYALVIDPITKNAKRYNFELPVSPNLPYQRISEMLEDKSGNIYFIAEGTGIVRLTEQNGNIRVFEADSGFLLSPLCYKLALAPSGKLIITSDKGITFFDPEKLTSRHLLIQSGIPLSGIIEENGLYVARNGEIFVGGIDGMVSFFEHELEPVSTDYNLYFSKLFVNNQLVAPGDHTGILENALSFSPNLVLKHGQTNINIWFASSNYIRHLSHEYEYMLEGFDKSWIPAQSQNITYTNISPGSYTLRVREKNPDNPDNSKEAVLEIKVTPAWYASQLAYALYFSLFMSLVIGYIIFDRNRTMLKASLEFERKEKERIEELNQSKLRFFTNISHEFRTPLTLINSQIELMAGNPSLPLSIQNQIAKIQKHAIRMRQLVNELLDFRKQEQGHLKLKVSGYDLVEFLNDIYQSFHDFAHSRSIDFI